MPQVGIGSAGRLGLDAGDRRQPGLEAEGVGLGGAVVVDAHRAQELLDLVDDLLRLAALRREQEPDKRQLVALDASLEQVVELMRAQASSKRRT